MLSSSIYGLEAINYTDRQDRPGTPGYHTWGTQYADPLQILAWSRNASKLVKFSGINPGEPTRLKFTFNSEKLARIHRIKLVIGPFESFHPALSWDDIHQMEDYEPIDDTKPHHYFDTLEGIESSGNIDIVDISRGNSESPYENLLGGAMGTSTIEFEFTMPNDPSWGNRDGIIDPSGDLALHVLFQSGGL